MKQRVYRFQSGSSTHSKTLRRMLFEERGRDCEICKKPFFHNIHHKDKNRQNNKLENLMLVCRKCHSNIHNGKIIVT